MTDRFLSTDAAGDIAHLHAAVEELRRGLALRPGPGRWLRRGRTTDQNVPDGTMTVIVWSQLQVADPGHGVTYSGSGVFTVSRPGRYRVTVQTTWATSGAGTRRLGVRINGALQGFPGSPGTGTAGQHLSWLGELTAGDTLDVVTSQSSGGTLALTAGEGLWIVIEQV